MLFLDQYVWLLEKHGWERAWKQDPYRSWEDAMLAVDPSEVRGDSRLVVGDLDFQVVKNLEEWTGADCMISALNAPANTPELIRMHLRHKAILVQRKHRNDLVSSLEDRLKMSLFKMRQFGAHQSQCVLLFIGVLTCDRDGYAQIDGQDTGRNFWSVYAGLSVWIKHGGVVEPPLSRASLFPDWVKFRTRHILDSINVPVKEFIQLPDRAYEVEADDPVQELVMIKDWRQTVLCCPGWGIKRVNALHQLILDDHMPDTLQTAISYMISDKVTRLPGVGHSLVDAAKRWYGITKVSSKEVSSGKSKQSRRVASPVARSKSRHR